MSVRLRNRVISTFKLHGLTLRSEASKHLVELLLPISDADRGNWEDKILEFVLKQQLQSPVIEKSHIQRAAQECSKSDEDENESCLSVISAWDVPNFVYSADRKKYLPSPDKPVLHGDAQLKAQLYKNRYTLLNQRTSRHELFTQLFPGHPDYEQRSKQFDLKPIEYLLGTTNKLLEIIVLGMITQLKEGKYYLEDPTGAVQLDLTAAKFHNGLFTENCFVLAEGWYDDKIFHASAIGFPPPEPANTTRAYFGNTNFFGGGGDTCLKSNSKLKKREQSNPDAMIIVLSDVWLDEIQIMDKLKVLFTGYSEMPPAAFVLLGNFLSAPHGPAHSLALKQALRSLADLITEFPLLITNSKFIFVPGPLDPGAPNIFPRPCIPKYITEDFSKRVPLSEFTTSPCRMTFFSRELIFFREDVLTKMCRNAVYFPTSGGDIPQHFAKTITSQAHMAPLPLHIVPIYWGWDFALRLYPLPDVVVVGDKFDAFTASHLDCTVVNPGTFSRNQFSFKVYYPSTNVMEDSQIPDEA